MYYLYRSQTFVKKVEECKNNPKKSFKIKVGEHIPYRYSKHDINNRK